MPSREWCQSKGYFACGAMAPRCDGFVQVICEHRLGRLEGWRWLIRALDEGTASRGEGAAVTAPSSRHPGHAVGGRPRRSLLSSLFPTGPWR